MSAELRIDAAARIEPAEGCGRLVANEATREVGDR
jgi:hypothetical protein